MTVKDILSDLFYHGDRVEFNDKILGLRETDQFRIVLGNDEHIYKIYWAEDMRSRECIPEKFLNLHVNQTKITSARGMVFFDCLMYPTKEYISKFNKKLELYR